MKVRSRTNADNLAAILVNCFIRKHEEDGEPKFHKNAFQAFTDPFVFKQRRWGWYAWLEYANGEEIASSIDCPFSYLEDGFNDNEVLSLILNHYSAWVNYDIKPFGSEEEFLEAVEHASST